MKTDKFDDAIRRKLESIEPPFRDRDWSHMQAFMHHHGYPPAWVGASQWLMPVAAAAAVTGLIVATVWQFHTNQQLNHSVQTLSQTVARLETTQAKLIKTQTRTDTVYVTNFTPTPTPATSIQSTAVQPAHAPAPAVWYGDYAQQPASPVAGPHQRTQQPVDANTQRVTAPVEQSSPDRLATAPQLAGRTEPVQPAANQPTNAVNNSNTPAERGATNSVIRAPATDRLTTGSLAQTAGDASRTKPTPRPDRLGERRSSTTGLTMSSSTGSQSGATQSYPDTRPVSDAGRQTGAGALPPDNQDITRQTDAIARLTIRPLMIDSVYYAESIARRTRRIRSLLPATVNVLATAPVEVASSRPVFSGVRVRLGVAGQLATRQYSLGAYSEVIIGKHWSIGVGLHQTNLQGGQFASDDQFERMTHTDFRQLYAPGGMPIHDITNIDRQFTLWQLPVNLGYRALLGKGFALTPSMGIDFSLSAQDNTTFTYRRGIFEYQNVSARTQNRPCDVFNTYTVALGAEKSWKHLVIQAGPVLATPTKSSPDLINPVSLGLRTRVLFQF